MAAGNPSTDSTLKRALRAIEDLQAKLAAREGTGGTDPIAVIGMGCRFPGGADDPAAFWGLLESGGDAIRALPRDRWNIDEYYDPDPDAAGKMYIRHGGFLERVDGFDAPFFGISPREAACMDPQHRLVLEVGWEALEDAGIAPAGLRGSRTGVFVGIGQNDYGRLQFGGRDAERIDTYDGTGNLFCFAPGRLAYILGLQGPNMAIDTACSSSLVAIHQACLSLRTGECDMAIAGGVHLVLSPEVTIFLSRAHVLAPDGRCKAFDAAADGFGRGEGCGMIVLKRLVDARRDRDRVLALIRGSAVNHDGASGGLTVPNERAQEELIRQAVLNAGVDPLRIGYVETHGTGTALGDPIEVNAISAALCNGRPATEPLVIGSVKTNLGHLEAAAGIAGVIKVILSLHHCSIPPHLHFRKPNPHIAWKALPVAVAAGGRPWSPLDGRRIAGVSSFGFSGTNGHVILEEAPDPPAERRDESGGVHCLALSAGNDAAIRALARRFEEHLAAHPEEEIGDVCFTVNTGRSPLSRRTAIVAATGEEFRERLAAFREGRACPGLYSQDPGESIDCSSPPVSRAASSAAGERVSDGDPASAAALARAFVQDGVVAWDDHYRGKGFRKVAVPTYPFQRQRYWVGEGRRAPRGPAEESRPWGQRLALPFSGEVRFAGRFSEDLPPHLADHRLLGTVVVSAASQVSLVLAAAAEAFGSAAGEILQMIFSSPLIIPPGETREFQLIFAPVRQGAYAFRVASRPENGGEGASWTIHSSGEVCPARVEGAVASDAASDPGALCTGARETLAGDEFYAARHRSGYGCGASFRWAERIWRGEGEILCALAPPRAGREESYPIHPGLLDSCFQMVGGFGEETDAHHLLVPMRIGRLTLYRKPPGGRLWCVAHREAAVDRDALTCAGSLRLTDEGGGQIAVVDGLELGPAPRALFLRETREKQEMELCAVRWRQVPQAGAEAPVGKEPPNGCWLLFVDRSGVSEELAAQLRARGERVLCVTQEARYVRSSEDHYGVDPETPADFDRLVQEIIWPLRGMVYLWGIDLESADGEALSQCETLCGAATAVVRALARRGGGPALWFVTRGAQALDRGPAAPLQAAFWGLAAVMEIEHPELTPRCIDLDPASAGTTIGPLLDELLRPGAENRIALHGGVRRAARLERCAQAGGAALRFDAGATYLITGGLGGLGLEIAHWMALKGARCLMLAGRSEPGPAALERIGQVERTGCRVRVFSADVSDRQAVERLTEAIAEAMPPLRGIVHAAGVIDDAVLIRQERNRFRTVMAPKVRGAWNLQEATAGIPLDFFVCFSSAAAVIGAGGQANYAAANACLDAFVQARRAEGLHGLSVNWGAWDKVGMAARMSDPSRERWAGQGVGFIDPGPALEVLGGLLRRDATQALAMAVDWGRYLAGRRMAPPLFESLAGRRAEGEKAVRAEWLAEAPAGERPERLLAYLRSQLAATLGMASPEALEPRQRLFDLGMDSLMAVEMKNRLEKGLGVSLRSTLLFDYPTLEALAKHLGEEVLGLGPAPLGAKRETPQAGGDIGSLLAQVEALSEEDLRIRFAGRKGRG